MTSQTTALRRSTSPVLARPLAAVMATVAALALALLSGCGGSSSAGPTGPTGPTGPGAFSITSVVPASGPSAGGTAVTVSGVGLVAGATVSFGSVDGAVSAATGATLAATTPVHGPGAVTVVVTLPDGRTASKVDAFTFVAPPVVTSVQPGQVATGGEPVLVNGSGFSANAQVFLGGVASDATRLSEAQLAVSAPAHAAGAVDVRVVNADGQQAVLAGALTYSDATPPPPQSVPPVPTGLAPGVGPEAGGTVVVISGSKFDPHVLVTFGGQAASVSGVTGTQVTAVTPPHLAGPVDVVVTNPPNGAAVNEATLPGAFTYQAPPPPPAPAVSGVTPATGSTAGGQQVTVTGTGFAAGATVTFGGASAPVVSTTATAIVVTTPAHAAGAVAVAVRNPDAQAGSLAGGFTYQAPPLSLAGVSPATGPVAGGTAVTLAGTGFAAGATVTFGGSPAGSVVVASPTQITCTTPAHGAGAVDVVVANPGAGSATRASGFTYLAAGQPAPSVTGVTPSSAPVGVATSVTVQGTNLVTGVAITFGGVPVAGIGTVTPTGVQVSVIGTASGVVDVSVRNPDGQTATLAGGFTFLAAPPVITALNRRGAPPAGGLLMLIVGTGFSAGSTVTFGGVPATGVSYDATLKALSLTVPPHAEGFVDIVVQNPDGQADTFAGFHYGPLPVITDFNPKIGQKGDTVTLTGDFLDPTASVAFGSTLAVVTARGAGTISVTVPKMNPGFYPLVVTNADGQFGVSSGSFELPGP